MATSLEIRQYLIETLQLDLVGPEPSDILYQEEILPTAPSKWYLTGFLVPYETPLNERSDLTENEELDQIEKISVGDDENIPERASARKAFFPSSMGLSFFVNSETKAIEAEITWGDYQPFSPKKSSSEKEEDENVSIWGEWRRTAKKYNLRIPLEVSRKPRKLDIPSEKGLQLSVLVRPVQNNNLLPQGTYSVSIFFVNDRRPGPDVKRDIAYVFQAKLVLRSAHPFIPRPDFRGRESEDWDDTVAYVQYRDAMEYAVGHNISAVSGEENGNCFELQTAWMPQAEVEKVIPADVGNIELNMEKLANIETPEALRAQLNPILNAYQNWIETQREKAPKNDLQCLKIIEELLLQANTARNRIQEGIQALMDPKSFEAFQMMNRVIARSIRQRNIHGKSEIDPKTLSAPKWRPFQLAFVLMNIPGILNPEHPDRKVVDLLFFPTGGGKTEAYLGLATFTMVLRRLKNPGTASLGVAVLMRYTLRLLTLDQLSRAATLICALELERQENVEKLGIWPFEIGLWVGQTATPNKMGRKGDNDSYSARARTIAFLNDDRKPSPIPLENCPWCGTKFSQESFHLFPNTDTPTELRISCLKRNCEFSVSNGQKKGLPILAVDEPIYRRLPAFVIATVDKFANLPWVGDTAGLFGRVERYDNEGFYGQGSPLKGKMLEKQILPPELIIQDELHLISGPLGTLVGLYETAVDALATTNFQENAVRPKIVASTATVRRANKQIQALFARSEVDIFPPPGPDRRDSFFAKTVSSLEASARKYIGITAQGRNQKVVLLRTYLALLSAAQKKWMEEGGTRNKENPVDPYMTILGYFNSLRELGGSRRIVEDEVKSRLEDYSRRCRIFPQESLFADRKKFNEPCELTSRVSTNEVANTKRRLALTFHEDERVDVALATNMISVGLDIIRLGLMVVLGQPKTTSEYIQTTSRVGRDDQRPGLVVCLLNVNRPRDRSHYERFIAWHKTFYRSVEATSVTPFSPRALDRGIPGIVIALARLGLSALTAPASASLITPNRPQLQFVEKIISQRAEEHNKDLSSKEIESLQQNLRARVNDLLDSWERVAEKCNPLQYQKEVGLAPPLLYDPLDPELERKSKDAKKFKLPRSLRDVEPIVHLWVKRLDEVQEKIE